MKRFTITTPIFYVNGPPHIGHAYSAVAADVLARAHRLHSDDVFFLTGTDEHGAKIAEAAATAGKSPQAFADEIATTFRSAWEALDVHTDDFIRTTEARHERGVVHALRVLHERGHLYEKSYRGLYCTGCENFVTTPDLDTEGKCPLHNQKPTEVEEKNWFFRLSAFLPEVQRRIESDELKVSPPERKNEALGLLGRSDLDGERSDLGVPQTVSDFSISRPQERVPWAIPFPFDESQTCYVWVDALLNYVTALGYGQGANSQLSTLNSQLNRYWPADVQLIGQDILKFHAVYWPALLLALNLPLPKELFVHGFFTVNGQKISKSLGNAIDPLALVKRYGSDATRFLLLSQFPFGASGDVQVSRFDEQYNAVLANTIGNLVSRVISLLQKFSDSKIPNAQPDQETISDFVRQSTSGPARSALTHEVNKLVEGPAKLAVILNQYADLSAPWKETDVAKRAVALRTLADGVVSLALLAEPVLPRTAAAIQRAFRVENRQLPTPGTLVQPTNPPVLFPRAAVSDGGLTG